MAEKIDGCELCEAAPLTARYHADDVCWVAECESCGTPMVVWNWHGAEPPADDVTHMLGALDRVAADLYGVGGYSLDRVMRQIPTHFHAHARDRSRWARFGR